MNNSILEKNSISTSSVYEQNDFSFEVIFEENIFNEKNTVIKKYCNGRKSLVIISQTIKEFYYPLILNYFEKHSENNYKIIVIPTGEVNKTIENVLKICKEGKDFKLDRKSLLVGIGGGVLLDIVGFAASMFKRKLSYLRIPTTLLGQVDAGIGIKTGVNFDGTKNYIGSFHPPIACINDVTLLKSLHENEFLCGFAEIIKMAVIMDDELFETIEVYGRDLIKSKYAINTDVSNFVNKRAVDDMLLQLHGNFFENCLQRLVDFGHTFSSYVEEKSNYSVSHGIAVAMDIAISTEIAYLKGFIQQKDHWRILKVLNQTGFRIYDAKYFDAKEMFASLNWIILHRGSKLNLVVPTGIGEAMFIEEIEDINIDLLEQAFNNLMLIQSDLDK